MRERPILFGGDMVRAILDGRKTQTRRPIAAKNNVVFGPRQTRYGGEHRPIARLEEKRGRQTAALWCPFGVVGDRLWVRETHATFNGPDGCAVCAYRASVDGDAFDYVGGDDSIMRLRVLRWTPSTHMPRWASRLTLEITEVRVERLQDISEADARAEGVKPLQMDGGSFLPSFEGLWDAAYSKSAPWSSNPWVWVLSFKQVESSEGKVAAHG